MASEPLLTIEEATREFRVSPKTIRRRLTAGEIDGAYKRPGDRGPEWVMPRSSLAAAGFVPRGQLEPEGLPEGEAAADYWARRALDAEAAIRASAHATADARPERRGVGWPWYVVTGVLVAAALVTGLLIGRSGDGDGATGSASTREAVRLVLAEMASLDGGPIGVVGDVPRAVLPEGRETVRITDATALDGVRSVVARADGQGSALLATLGERSTTVLRLPDGDGHLLVLDAHSPPATTTTTAEPGSTTTTATSAPTPTEPAAAAPPGPASAAPSVEVQGSEPAVTPPGADATSPPPPTAVTVEPGDSFWSIAETLAAAEPGGGDVATVWAELIDANADRLLEPGNPDLLHVGQVLVVPPGR